MTRGEKRELDLIAPESLVRHRDLQELVFRIAEDGQCVHRGPMGCGLHAKHGPQAKPTGCARFPYGLVATPDGGRVTTEHRCPCRSLGDRPPLDLEDAERSLFDTAGRLVTDARVPERVSLVAGRKVLFRTYTQLEAELLPRLAGGEDPLKVLEARPLGKLDGTSWGSVVKTMEAERDGTAYGEALTWFAYGLDAARGRAPMRSADRPWKWSFDIAQKRPGRRSDSDVFGDWAADWLWSLAWTYTGTCFHQGAREFATLYAVAQEIAGALIRKRVRADRAAAEAVMVVELTALSDVWERVQDAMDE